ncbi:Hint domain-containing protein [Sulfitobacter sp. MF3-043]|uniref:Hint domain-containing protein n=1 Tax=Sulfitobacter sediminivivens TaxID=3252902 RepID=UPI0036DB74E1
MADKLDGLIISEILADNGGGSAFDTDGDGEANKADEFVEIQNTTNSAISLDGYEIWSEKAGQLYSFGPGDTIAAGGTATVVGEYIGTPPAGYYDSGASNSVNWLPDGEGQKFDSIFLVNSVTGEYVVLSYGVPPRTPTLPSGFPGTTRIGAGETIASNAPNGTAFSRDINGDFVESAPTPGAPGVPCFCPGTLIETVKGPVTVEKLRPGMLLRSLDSVFEPLLGIKRHVLPAARVFSDPTLLPVLLPAGSFGNSRPLMVSPNHRIMLRSLRVSMLFGGSEVLVAAKHLLPHGATRVPFEGRPQSYYHLLFKDHVILQANGLWTESLFLGDVIDQDESARCDWDFVPGTAPSSIKHAYAARPILRRYEAHVLLERAA